MEIKTNNPLQALNTFHIKVDGKFYLEVASVKELQLAWEFAQEHSLPLLILGGGSNILFTEDFPGLVMKVNFKGIEIIEETEEYVMVKAGAGEVWDEFVAHCVENGFGGLENLSLIPGSVGASPVQNIGAYGVEMKDYFESLEFYDFQTQTIRHFEKQDCHFAYRNSIFKKELKGKGVVVSVTFKLTKKPEFKTGYGSIREELQRMGTKDLSIDALRRAVIQIRRSKLPDPEEIGNAGSFFKNPSVAADIHEILASENPRLVSFPQAENTFKLAAGWLIDQCGWKGYRAGDAGVHKNQALVLVNYGEATGQEIYELSEKIRESVLNRFHIELECEVNVL